MPKASKKYYAVAVGRDSPKVYASWDECREKVTRYPRALFKSFSSSLEADEWLASQLDLLANASLRPQKRPLSRPDLETSKIPVIASYKQDNSASKSEYIEEEYIALDAPYPDPLAAQLPSQPLHPPPTISLSPEQRYILDQVKSGRSIFFTGSAGTGKSVLLNEIIQTLDQQNKDFGITASTGIAAINIGGCTLHSWAGIGLGNEDVTRYVGKFFGNKSFGEVLRRWQKVQTLIVDEVSMIDGSLFDKLEEIARALRKNNSPFGGIQLILSGDFCQLPPVPGRNEKGQQVTPVFAFDAETWNACVGPPMALTQVFRQKDQEFANMLNAMRFGRLDAKATSTFSELSREVRYTDGIGPAELFSTRHEVNNANEHRLRQLDTETRSYQAYDRPGYDSNNKPISHTQMSRLLERLVVPNSVTLKIGAQVMLVKNLEQGTLVNGSIGQVVRFSRAQDALKNSTRIAGLPTREKKNLPRDDLPWPVVRFIGGDEALIIPHEFTINNAYGDVEAARTQVPLILAWALSIHKSQGQTLERVKVDLKRVFEVGQAYVALSRATSLEGLQVLNFDASKVAAHPRVLQWYSSLVPASHTIGDHIIELSDSDEPVHETSRRKLASHYSATAEQLSRESIELTDSEDESFEEVAMSWYFDP